MTPIIPNHNGYGLRNDERPFAHKIPPGGNWKALPREDQVAFMKGALNSGGGQTMYLRRLAWDEPALTVLASPNAKATCQLHPGKLDVEEAVSIRNYNVTPQLPPNGLTVAEFFCGGGLMAVGLKAAGYDITFANDFDKRAAEAYAYNLGDYVVCGDITSDEIQTQIPDADIFAGGPPCQDYSVAGTGTGEEGERGKLVWTYLDIIARKQPKAFVFENVKGLTQKKHRHTLDALLVKFAEIGYNVSWRIINAWDYGVAQKRERVFIVGVRKDIGFTFEFPEPCPEDYRTQVLRDVIGDLPEPYTEGAPANQDTIPKSAFREYKFDSANDGAVWDDPSWTIRAGTITGQPWHPRRYENHDEKSFFTPKSEYNNGQPIHPIYAPRRFTVRECLRIQSVPDWYVLPDTIKLSPQYRIVGNGVASRVSYLIGQALAEQLNAALTSTSRSLPEAA